MVRRTEAGRGAVPPGHRHGRRVDGAARSAPLVVVYALLARPRAEAIALCILCALAVASSVLILRLPWDRFVRSPWREAYFGAWSVLDLLMIVIATVLEWRPGQSLC